MPADQDTLETPSLIPSAAAAAARPRVAAELRQVSLEMPDACERLEYVGKMTERAANRVLADLTRDVVRTKAMALIGVSIGLMFAVSLVLGPFLNSAGGLRLIFAVMAALALAASADTAGFSDVGAAWAGARLGRAPSSRRQASRTG